MYLQRNKFMQGKKFNSHHIISGKQAAKYYGNILDFLLHTTSKKA